MRANRNRDRARRRPAGSRAVGIAVRVATWSALAGACVALGGSMLASAVGLKTMVVTSGSMAPAFAAGDAVLLRAAHPELIRVGDVITFHPLSGDDRLTTHRVLSLRRVQGDLHLQTKGDANAHPDADLVPAGHVVGEVAVIVPGVGRLLLFAATPAGRLTLVGAPALVLLLQQLLAILGTGARRAAVVRPA